MEIADREAFFVLFHHLQILQIIHVVAGDHIFVHTLTLIIQNADRDHAVLRTILAGQMIHLCILVFFVLEEGGIGAHLCFHVTSTELLGLVTVDESAYRQAITSGVLLAPLGSQHTTVFTVLHSYQVIRFSKGNVLQTLMQRLHNLFPHIRSQEGGGIHRFLNVVTHPNSSSVVRSVTHKPLVAVIVGGTGLAGNVLPVEVGTGTGTHTGHDHVPQQSVDIVCSAFLQYCFTAVIIFIQHGLVAFQIHYRDTGNGTGLHIHTVVGKGGIRSCHFISGHTIGQTTQAQRCQVNVRRDFTVGLLTGLHQRSKAKAFSHILIRGLRSDQITQNTHSNGVDRVVQCFHQGGKALVVVISVGGPGLQSSVGAGLHSDRHIVHHGGQGDQSQIQSGGIHRKRLDRGSGRTLGIGGAVKPAVAFLFADTARQRYHVAGRVLDHRDGRLNLLPGLGVHLHGSAVIVDGIHISLYIGIQIGHDLQAAIVHHILGDLFAQAQFIHENIQQLGNDLVFIPCVNLLRTGGAYFAVQVQFLRDGCVTLRLGNHALLAHQLQSQVAALQVILGETVGISSRGVLSNGNQRGTFGQAQVLQFLAVVVQCSGVYTVAAVAQIDIVQIPFQNLVLGMFLLKLQCGEDLQNLTFDGHVIVLSQVLNQLLGQGGTTLNLVTGDHAQNAVSGTLPVHTGVGAETLVLNGDGGIDQILGDL